MGKYSDFPVPNTLSETNQQFAPQIKTTGRSILVNMGVSLLPGK